MSASREKQNRQELEQSGYVDPKTELEAQQAKKEKRSNTLYAVIGVVFVLALVASLVWRSNIIPKKANAATVDGQKYSAAEVNFYYWNGYNSFVNNYSYLLGYFGLSTASDPDGQTVNETAAGMLGVDAGITWGQYFRDQAVQQLSAVQNALKMAEAEGYVYSDDVQAQYDATLESLEATAAANGTNLKGYLTNAYGALMTEEVFTEELMRVSKYSDYITSYHNGLTFTDDEIKAAYEENTATYDRVSYESVSILGSASSTTDAEGKTVEPTDEEKEAAKAAAKETADKLLAAYKEGKSLETESKNAERATYTKDEEATNFTSDLGTWLYDDARKSGDTTVIESGTTYYVAVFHDRFRPDYTTQNVRHLLITPAAGTLAAEDEGYQAEVDSLKAEAKAKAEALLAEWKAGEATEESFAALATANSADGGSASNGGLYEDVYKGQMVEPFEDWCFASGRKTGDTGVVETSYGYHVMYYVSAGIPTWQFEVTTTLRSEAYNAWLAALPEGSTIEQSDFGMGFVG